GAGTRDGAADHADLQSELLLQRLVEFVDRYVLAGGAAYLERKDVFHDRERPLGQRPHPPQTQERPSPDGLLVEGMPVEHLAIEFLRGVIDIGALEQRAQRVGVDPLLRRT